MIATNNPKLGIEVKAVIELLLTNKRPYEFLLFMLQYINYIYYKIIDFTVLYLLPYCTIFLITSSLIEP